MFDREGLRLRQAEWTRFHDWEARNPPSQDLDATWHWYEEMYDLGRQLGAIPTDSTIDNAKIRYLMNVQERLARLVWPK